MNILALSDQECAALWDYYTPGKLAQYDLILSCGDLKAEYLRFLVTMGRAPLMYVHGNHDGIYAHDEPEGCDCVDDKVVLYKGLRILGLGGSIRYSGGAHQYTQKQMQKRIRKLQKTIRLVGGVDIVLAHGAPQGVGDGEDLAHHGFEAFLQLMEQYQPRYFLHGHVHRTYGSFLREKEHGATKVVNCYERYAFTCRPAENTPRICRLRRLLHSNLVVID